jgi:uncharacterized protein DUF6801
MTGPGRTAWRAPRAAARITALAAVLMAGGLAAGTASASGTQPAAAPPPNASLTYQCRFPSGPRPVRVAVRASVPAVARAGKPIQPAGVSLTMTLPPAAVSGLASLGSRTVRAATRLTVSASEGPSGTSVVWPGTTRRPAARPAHGSLTLTTAGAVPSVTASSAGQVVLTAAGLSVTFAGGKAAVPAPGPAQPTAPTAGGPAAPPAGGGATPAPSGQAPAPLTVTCAPAPGQHATLATLLVGGRPSSRPARHAAAVKDCPTFPTKGFKLNPRFHHPKPPPGSVKSTFLQQGCAFTTGYADARKLKGAALIQPGLTNVELFVLIFQNQKKNYFQADNAAELDFHGQHEFPPSQATFLTFGFVPTTASIELVEHGTIDIFAVGPLLASNCKPHQPCSTIATVASQLSVKIVPGSVNVNGVPLDVGPNCETPPFDAVLTGSDASNPPYSVQNGGPLTGTVTIPKFQNCGVGENLDPIFNAAISGPRNFNLLTQGVVCFVQGGGLGCDKHSGLPKIPTPLRKVIG